MKKNYKTDHETETKKGIKLKVYYRPQKRKGLPTSAKTDYVQPVKKLEF